MQDSDIRIEEYGFTAISGTTYHPIFRDHKWYIVNFIYERSIFDIAYLCEIPEDEVIILRLKYGG